MYVSERKPSTMRVAMADRVIAFFRGKKLYFSSLLSVSVPLLLLTAAWNSLSPNALTHS